MANELRYGMVGGGPGAFIGDVHRKAAAFDGKAVLVAGSFSSSFDKTKETGKELGLDDDRLYKDYSEMAKAEAQRKDGIDFVSIVTPNNAHYPVAKAFLEQGIHVICDKPLTTSLAHAEELEKLAKDKGLLFGVTYTYTGYVLAKQARHLIQSGELGEIRFVSAEYAQDWLATPMEKEGLKQAEWRTDPKKTGIANSVGDIGTHVENMVSYMTGMKITRLSARLDSFVEGRQLDDNASIMVEYNTGAKGLYWVSQIAIGHDNGLRVRVYGTKASLEFLQEEPNHLYVRYLGGPETILSRGRDAVADSAERYNRVPAGHPEGLFVAFANIYKTFAEGVDEAKNGKKVKDEDFDYPGVAYGVEGVRFIEKCVESSKAGAKWIDF
jgi:predicted dehydrogenase